jgi:hypothetical protein
MPARFAAAFSLAPMNTGGNEVFTGGKGSYKRVRQAMTR